MGSLCTNCLVLEGQREAGSVAGGFIRLMLGDTTAHHLTGVIASPLTSPGNASNCNLPSVAPRRFLCSCANSPPLRLSCTAATAGLLPACGDAAFKMWFLRKRWSVVGAGASQRPKAPGGLCHQLCARRATPGVSQHGGHGDILPPLPFPCSLPPALHLTVLPLSSVVLCLK